ncbi:DEAD/DEAH box helicase [Natribacillus halophilus]|uniref:Helicase conserved C-terminal domain-containing protein n=1 Tax=Natribacillus halophilus TaxID=549003 RepID=A0A1G8N3F9_9BACI|nr:SNF2-related protein [Natribacillus halophilus]SDI74655.1 Helicase conserved C-terminal domain-containing protein [Natribacillus halophilus]
MQPYLFHLNKDLLEINALEMDGGLSAFFASKQENTFEFVNGDQSLVRTFTVNWEEQAIQGRGIKGFFNPYDNEYLLIDENDEGQIKITPAPKPQEEWLQQFNMQPEARDRTHDVLEAMDNFRQNNEKWFDLYKVAQQFRFSSDTDQDELLSLPHLRDMETFDYQVNTVQAVLNRFKGRALLCDEVGLGKTVEAGMAMQEYIMRGLAGKILILCPPSLVQQWEQEMKRKFNQDFIRADDPAFKKQGTDAWAHFPKVIASIATAKRKQYRSAITDVHYDLVIVDEAHHLKNRKTMAWQFVNEINKKYIFLLTATPVQNNLEELYNLITLLKPGQLKTYRYFKKNFVEDNQGMEAKNVDQLKRLLSDVMIRNKRNNVDVRFTNRKAQTTTVALSAAEEGLYHELSAFIRSKYNDENSGMTRFQLKNLQEQMGSSFYTLVQSLEKQVHNEKLHDLDRRRLYDLYEQAYDITQTEAANNAKVRELISILSATNEKTLVFTKYQKTQQLLAWVLKEQGFRVAEFHGGLKRKEKEEQVDFFKDQAQVLVSTEVGGEGRNLQFCNTMINFDLPWNPMAIEQRIGRIHRIGQERDVFVYNLVAQNTLEHHILHILDRKVNMFELVVGEVDMILGDIEAKDDFSDIVMRTWVDARDRETMEKEMDDIGEKMLANKQQLDHLKKLDKQIF